MPNTIVFEGIILESRIDALGRKLFYVLTEHPERNERQRVKVCAHNTTKISGTGNTVRGAGSAVFGEDCYIFADVLQFKD